MSKLGWFVIVSSFWEGTFSDIFVLSTFIRCITYCSHRKASVSVHFWSSGVTTYTSCMNKFSFRIFKKSSWHFILTFTIHDYTLRPDMINP
jgi:hypothetical protein